MLSKIDSLISHSGAAKEDVVEQYLLKNDLSYFAERVLDMEIVNHHKEWSELVSNDPRIAINASRDHGKSYFFCFAYVLWRAYYHWIPPSLGADYKSIPRISLGYIFSNTQDQAIKHLEIVKHELETNDRLFHLIPDKKDTWSKQEIRLSNGAIIRARGWGVSVRGAHPVYVVCDDVLNEENLYSEITRRKEKDYMFSAVTPMLVPGGQLVVVGTPLHNDDLYADLKQNRSYQFRTYPACDENFGNVLWPTRYPRERLEAIRDEVGSTRFAREYRSIPISDDSSLFPERIVSECFDKDFEMPSGLTDEERTKLQVYTGVDLAMSATVGADFTVITTIGLDQYKNRWILDMRRKKGLSMTEQLREIEDVHRNFGPQKILIEDNNFQRVFKDELVRRTDMPVEGFTTTRYNKNSMEKGVPSLQILFENKKFVIARKTPRDRRITDVLVHELRCFSWQDGKLAGIGAHDDHVMSLWMANEACSTGSFSFSFA